MDMNLLPLVEEVASGDLISNSSTQIGRTKKKFETGFEDKEGSGFRFHGDNQQTRSKV